MMHLLTLMFAIAATGDHGRLLPCPSSPNCVSSQATDNHFIEPFAVTGEAKAAFNRLKKILEQRDDSIILSADDRVIRVEFRTMLGFVDDGLFILDEKNMVIHIRSAARSGYWDLGKNRRRMEEIRRQYRQTQGGILR
jgi:uncharacterized protein (DUF1499 family)